MSALKIRPLPVTEPGFYRLDAADYHLDPAPSPSLSGSMAGLILDAPLKAFTAHPRLNPNYEAQEADKVLDFGTCAHAILIGEGREIVEIDAPDWRTKAAKEARDAANEAGKVAILKAEHERAKAMAAAARVQLAGIADCETAFREGEGEIAAFWLEGETWCRALLDWIELRDGRAIVTDFKTTQASAAPEAGARRIYASLYHLQAAFHSRGVSALLPDHRVDFRFAMQEKAPPHLLTVFQCDPGGLSIGTKMADAALDLWRRCLSADAWPGYPGRIVTAELPGFTEHAWLGREMAEDALQHEGTDAFTSLNTKAPQTPEDLVRMLRAG